MTAASYSGPWVHLAAFCNLVLKEADGTLTLVRVVDRITHTVSGAGVPIQMEPFDHSLTLVIGLKPGEARGRHNVTLNIEGPDGITRPGPTKSVTFDNEDRGVNLIMELRLQFEREGLYWFDILLNEHRLTRVPLRVVYSMTSTMGQSAP